MCMVFNLLWTLVENPEDATKFLLWGDLANGPRRLHWRTRSSISPPSLRHCPVAVATEKKSSGPLLLWFTQDSVPFKRKKKLGETLWLKVVTASGAESMPTAASAVFSPIDGCNLPVAANCLLLEAAVEAGVGSTSSILPIASAKITWADLTSFPLPGGAVPPGAGSRLNTVSNRLPSCNQFAWWTPSFVSYACFLPLLCNSGYLYTWHRGRAGVKRWYEHMTHL